MFFDDLTTDHITELLESNQGDEQCNYRKEEKQGISRVYLSWQGRLVVDYPIHEFCDVLSERLACNYALCFTNEEFEKLHEQQECCLIASKQASFHKRLVSRHKEAHNALDHFLEALGHKELGFNIDHQKQQAASQVEHKAVARTAAIKAAREVAEAAAMEEARITEEAVKAANQITGGEATPSTQVDEAGVTQFVGKRTCCCVIS